MGRILITGALGNVGRYVAKYALKNNQDITVASRNIEALRREFGNHATCVSFDFTNPDTFDAALADVDRVFIMRPPHLGKPEDLKPFIHALQKRKNITLVCFLSLIGIEHNPVPPHYKIEKYIEKAGLPYCHIRPSFFMQNISGIHAFEIKHFNQLVVPVGKSLTSFIDAEDIGELTAKVLSEADTHKNSKYSLTGAEAIDYYEAASILSKHLNREIMYTNPKPSLAKKYWRNIRALDKDYVFVMGMLYMMTRLGTAKTVTTTYEDIMGKKPQSFSQFVEKNIDCWK
ncbi:conserved protein YesF [Lachnospiraceae bacterium KM106-2]|nr:conserved protein YesF [Lachnospiraceae bacterium KM106-2]